MNAKVTLRQWNGIEWVTQECRSLSEAIASIEVDPLLQIYINDPDSTGEICIENFKGCTPEVVSYNP